MTKEHHTVYPSMAFDHAIEAGVLHAEQGHPKYAGNFMYMYSERHGYHELDFFKNIETRKYITVKRSRVGR